MTLELVVLAAILSKHQKKYRLLFSSKTTNGTKRQVEKSHISWLHERTLYQRSVLSQTNMEGSQRKYRSQRRFYGKSIVGKWKRNRKTCMNQVKFVTYNAQPEKVIEKTKY
jgi:hypothetical protein